MNRKIEKMGNIFLASCWVRIAISKSVISIFVFASLLSGPVNAEDPSVVRELLLQRNDEFRQEIIRVSEHVYTAVGYGTGPVSMIVGSDGLVIVDTNIDVSFGKQVMSEFRKLTDKPVKAIIFTHGHADHTTGAPAFLEDGTQVWARDNFGAEDRPFADAGITITMQRAVRHGGMMLPEDEINHIGVSRRYIPRNLGAEHSIANADRVNPTHTFSGDRKRLEVAGIELVLVAANGETSDQLYVWFEKDRVLFSGDNFYRSWPNLYALRGTTYRDVLAWINSLSAMIEEKPHSLVAGHTRPLIGETETQSILTKYRDAIKYVFDKTVEGMNLGMTPDELVAYARLPEKYRELDYLRPYYGHPDWAVRSIFNAYLGWFDGNPSNLFPLSPQEEAARMQKLAGGRESLQRVFEEAAASGEYQWALQLVDYLLTLSPEETSLMLAKADVLDALSEQVLNATARNYYRTVALELRQAAD